MVVAVCKDACVWQWSCTVTRSCQSWRGSCSAPRTATWPTATTFSSRTGHSDSRPLCIRLLTTPVTLMIRTIWTDVDKLSTSSNRYLYDCTMFAHCLSSPACLPHDLKVYRLMVLLLYVLVIYLETIISERSGPTFAKFSGLVDIWLGIIHLIFVFRSQTQKPMVSNVVDKSAKIGIPKFRSLHRHSTTGQRIAMPKGALSPTINPLHRVKIWRALVQ